VSNLVFCNGDVIFITSIDLAKGVGHSHNSVLKLLRNSQDLEQLRDLKSRSLRTKGRTAEVFDLTEEQATLLITLMKNSPDVRQFKSKLVKEFYRMRKLLIKQEIERNKSEHLEARKEGIGVRHQETDSIKELVEYAKSQGSKNASKYYMAISKLENKLLFVIDHNVKNVRDLLDLSQLCVIKAADLAVIQTIEKGLSEQKPYKDIFQDIKASIMKLAEIFPPKKLAHLPQ